MRTDTALAPPPSGRLIGYDIARAVAILGMIIVHFDLVMASGNRGTPWVNVLIDALDGRAAALFVVLAGAGVSLRGRETSVLREVARSLRRRGVFLFIVGFLNLLIWPGDILRVYGVLLFAAPLFLRLSNRSLVLTALAFVAGFTALLPLLDYGGNWNWATMEYHHLWTPSGLVRNLFYDGFRAVFPWGGLFCAGMWLGRFDLSQPRTRRRFAVAGLVLMAGAILVSRGLLRHFTTSAALPLDEAEFLFGTASMPPLPLFLLTALGFAGTVIALGQWLAERAPENVIVRALAATGRMAFTWYLGHIVFGLGGVIVLGLHTTQPPAFAVATACTFFLIAAVLSARWMKRHAHGPLEALLRRVAG